MTREEERTKAAKDYADSIAQHEHNKLYSIDDFKAGTKWADKTMIEKACGWLRLTQPRVIMPDTTIERFKKAMEE